MSPRLSSAMELAPGLFVVRIDSEWACPRNFCRLPPGLDSSRTLFAEGRRGRAGRELCELTLTWIEFVMRKRGSFRALKRLQVQMDEFESSGWFPRLVDKPVNPIDGLTDALLSIRALTIGRFL